jgi:hypothetical protein
VRHRTHRISGGSIVGYGRPSYQEPEEDDFMALFKNVGEFKAAIRGVVKDEVSPRVHPDVGTGAGAAGWPPLAC